MSTTVVPVHYFGKVCHLHGAPLQWVEESFIPYPAGWKCPKCRLVCRVHKREPLRSSGSGLYCRTCRKIEIKKRPFKAHEISLSGAVIIHRTSP